MRDFTNIRDEPHYEIQSTELADWIERQGDHWWSWEWDPVLFSMHHSLHLYTPCPGEKLARALRALNRPLLVLDLTSVPKGKGEIIDSSQLDALAVRVGGGVQYRPGMRPTSADDRFFYLCWKGRDEDWRLREDLTTTESERAEPTVIPGSY
jgi:hypothetical protein